MNKVESLIIASLYDFMDLEYITKPDAKGKSNLVFPITRDEKQRVSEQEARLLFLQHVEKDGEFLYSIETPTTKAYKFSGKNERSGNIDVCLYGKEDRKRKHHIEFKALNPKQASFSKDFEKIFGDEEGLTNYFIHALVKTDSGTIRNIEKKYNEAVKNAIAENTDFKSCLVIFLCDMGNKEITRYDVDGKGELTPKIISEK